MTDGQQSRRRHIPRRLLLLTGLGIGAGLGIALTIDSPALADDHTPTLGAATTRTVHDATKLLTELGDHPAPAPQRRAARTATPRPIRDLGTETRRVTERAIRDTGAAVKHTTDRVDEATQRLPVAGRTVDDVTDVTDRAVDIVSTTPRLPAPIDVPIDVPDIAPAPAGHTPAHDAPQAAPETAPHSAPTAVSADSGATTTPAVQYPAAPLPQQGTARPAASESRPHTYAAVRDAVTTPHREPAGHRHLDADGDHADQPCMSNTRSIECTATGAWFGPSRWQQAVIEYLAQHAGRTEQPTPPPG